MTQQSFNDAYPKNKMNATYNLGVRKVATDLKRGTTFHTTANNSSGEIVANDPCHNAHNIFRSSSTSDLKLQDD